MSELQRFNSEDGQSGATYKAQIEAHIRRLLLRGDMQVGQIYSANSMAKELHVSNSPVREAMMSLVERHLLELVRNRGFRVVELDSTDVWEIYQLRRLVEVEAVRVVAASRLDSVQVKRLEELAARTDELSKAVTRDDMFDYLEADHHFHLYLVSLTGNRRWVEAVERLRDQSRVNGLYLNLLDCGKVADTAGEHLEIVDAVVTRDVQRAMELMVAHLEYARTVTGEKVEDGAYRRPSV
ncbi:GntR family transcriptional regulator [Corynebacterium ciconiae]|uniref:GntR family transcriptional regulator n=1 Tax=Corynebacterium ciconiae TaxID=227319 RepID=UPI00036A22DA|nr:GntR family transcriptional regulator [Corynebacterium ciconiae]